MNTNNNMIIPDCCLSMTVRNGEQTHKVDDPLDACLASAVYLACLVCALGGKDQAARLKLRDKIISALQGPGVCAIEDLARECANEDDTEKEVKPNATD